MSPELIYTDILNLTLNEKEINKLIEIIPAYFREKVRASKNENLKLQRLASGLLFSYAMKREGCEPGDIVITELEQGKPMLINPKGLYFNISHSEGLVLLAVCDAEIGCDIQRIKNGDKVAERFFTDDEKRVLDEADEAERDRLFTRLWARKESYIKATGEGMRRDLGSFSVLEDVTPDGYFFADHDLADFRAAVCVRGPFARGDICLIPFQKIVNVVS